MKKRLRSLLCALLAMTMLSSTVVCFAQDSETGKKYHDYGTYVLLGDSVAAGYSDVTPIDCEFKRVDTSYGAIVADTIGAELIPMACPGFRTIEMRYMFEDDYEGDDYLFHDASDPELMESRIPAFRQAVADAGLITLGLGGNDVGTFLSWVVLDALAQGGEFDEFVAAAKEMLESAGIQNDTLTSLLDLAAVMGALPGVLEVLPEAIEYGISNYIENWDYVIQDIYDLNPDVTLLVVGLFDTGYKTEEDLENDDPNSISHKISQTLVDAINAPMKAGADKFGYIFVETSGTVCDISHPTPAGYRNIANKILAALPEDTFPFTDVSASDSYYNAVKYVYENGIMNGTSETTFSPDSSMTRAQLVEALYRLAGSPDVSGMKEPFLDVNSRTASYDAIVWAYNEGIVTGIAFGLLFTPNCTVTRAQLSAMLYRWAGSPQVSGSLSYIDRYVVPSYAKNAVIWASTNGIVAPTSSRTFSPLRAATRAEVASGILQVSAM
ncbi:MAG TPA: S-layer homology domain-containing protein [Candidatus Scubalenecus merdavium]|uniref:S-layer homology domain-containing protein n=1 Tax=Candidatus Scybalenecus merdavium TaxID=2840939 RepID=A0A9D1MVC4_9FIRM|nr:S-layer homology domain-containing protein [Candidatus Scubalenecus merdavium]